MSQIHDCVKKHFKTRIVGSVNVEFFVQCIKNVHQHNDSIRGITVVIILAVLTVANDVHQIVCPRWSTTVMTAVNDARWIISFRRGTVAVISVNNAWWGTVAETAANDARWIVCVWWNAASVTVLTINRRLLLSSGVSSVSEKTFSWPFWSPFWTGMDEPPSLSWLEEWLSWPLSSWLAGGWDGRTFCRGTRLMFIWWPGSNGTSVMTLWLVKRNWLAIPAGKI